MIPLTCEVFGTNASYKIRQIFTSIIYELRNCQDKMPELFIDIFIKRKCILTGLLPVPTGSFSSSDGGGKLWHALISSKHAYHLSTFIARHVPYKNKHIY
jgi:hypothetical protein